MFHFLLGIEKTDTNSKQEYANNIKRMSQSESDIYQRDDSKNAKLKDEEKISSINSKYSLHNENTSTDKDSVLKQIENMAGRNYSDFMRSLASKYNQQ